MDREESVQLIQAAQQAVRAHPEIGGNFPLDDAVIEALPPGTKVISAESYGNSAWSVTARIHCEPIPDGPQNGFFLKCTTEDSGRAQLEGEFAAMTELRKTISGLVPKPITWGKFHLPHPPTYFFLIEFVNVSDRLPDPAKLGAAIAELHRKSVSPNGKFGFHIQTYDGKLPHNVEYQSDWPTFFVQFLTSVYDQDVIVNGVWKDLETIFKRAMTHVVPRLLGVLEADGRKIKPCLIHADLWEGNIGTEYETGKILLFDSCGFYAHNELELGQWRCRHRHLRARPYKKEYLRHFAASEPVEEFDDRNRLYSLNEQIMYSAHTPGTDVRHDAYQDLCYLVEKYAPNSPDEAATTPPVPVAEAPDSVLPLRPITTATAAADESPHDSGAAEFHAAGKADQPAPEAAPPLPDHSHTQIEPAEPAVFIPSSETKQQVSDAPEPAPIPVLAPAQEPSPPEGPETTAPPETAIAPAPTMDQASTTAIPKNATEEHDLAPTTNQASTTAISDNTPEEHAPAPTTNQASISTIPENIAEDHAPENEEEAPTTDDLAAHPKAKRSGLVTEPSEIPSVA